MASRSNQATLGGDKVQYPECEHNDCSNQSTRVFVLRGLDVDETYRCDEEDHEPHWKGPGGIKNVRPVEPQRDAVNTEGDAE